MPEPVHTVSVWGVGDRRVMQVLRKSDMSDEWWQIAVIDRHGVIEFKDHRGEGVQVSVEDIEYVGRAAKVFQGT